jgi:uncharacterized repeat protein (TIGR03803 family)
VNISGGGTETEEFMKCNRGSERVIVALMATVILALGLAPGAWAQSKYKTLHRFTRGADGAYPTAGPLFDQAGNLYGTTAYGGNQSGCASGTCGVVFKLTASSNGGWKESVLYAFCPQSICTDGSNPLSGVIFDAAGNLYGTSYTGGGHYSGTVFELIPKTGGGWTESVLYSFTGFDGGGDGGNPYGGLIFDSSGNLYGTTSGYGKYNEGTVFKLTPHSGGGWTETVLYDFTGGNEGGGPYAGVISDAQGNLYGTTVGGGKGAVGVVFRLSPSKKGVWQISVLHSFTGGRDGGNPYAGSLIMDAAGSLYGTTSAGGAYRYGTVFKLTQSGGKWKESVLHSFANGRDGAVPYSGLVFDSVGNLYGTTVHGGDLGLCSGNGCGVVFKLAPNSKGGWRETALHVFHDHPGASSNAGVILDAAGDVYGTTFGDGPTTFGSVFEIMP